MDRLKVAIIGAGPSGLSQLRAFRALGKKGSPVPELVCSEKQDEIGGLWNYEWRTGLDAYGEPVHCSMYRYLWSNGPKECLEFADYSFDEHFGRPIGSYPPRAVLLDYIRGRIERDGIADQVRRCHAVRIVNYHSEAELFEVTVHDLKKDQVYSEFFNYVVIASGHFSVPVAPSFPGLDSFNGRAASSYRKSTQIYH